MNKGKGYNNLSNYTFFPFDTSLAERLIEDNESSMEQVMAMGESFSNRLREMNERILSWQNKGISLHPGEKIYPHELLDWEAEMPEIEIMAQAQYEALTQWKHFKKIWPEKANTCLLYTSDAADE